MAETHVISALTKKRAELSGEIQHYQKLIKSLKENLTHIDQTIKIFDENYNIDSIKPKRVYKNRFFKNGEAKLMILDVLRERDKALSISEISLLIAKKKEINEGELIHLEKSILTSLKTQEKSNLIEQKDNLWHIKD